MMNHQEMVDRILQMGAQNAAVIPMSKVRFEMSFRDMCASNACGMYGKSWMCPPYVGEPEELVARAQKYEYLLVYQTIGELEDSYDFEGMMEAGQKMNDLTQRVRDELKDEIDPNSLLLGAGGCRLCPVFAKREDKPCRFPDKALASLEAYCISVSDLAASCGMKYINGQNTVTYFGAVMFNESK